MKKIFLYFFVACFVSLPLSSVALAQSSRTASSAKDLYVISAKAGGVNFVEGEVTAVQKNNRSGLLLKGDNLEAGQAVATGKTGRAEILLNPGSYVRLAENSGFEFSNTSLDDLQVKLNRGSAIFEVIADDELKITVSAPKASFSIVKSGIYRVDVAADGTAKLEVWKGKAQIGESEKATLKGGRAVNIGGGEEASIEKFDRDEKDVFELWSKSRAKELAKTNSRLQRQDVRNTLISSFDSQRWSMYDSFGLWVFDPLTRGYCFLPFGYGWRSPYGYGFGRDIWYYRLPPVIYNQPPPIRAVAVDDTQAARVNRRREANKRNAGDNPQITPPFRRLQKDIGRDPMERQDAPARPTRRQAPMPIIIAPSPSSTNDMD